MPLQSNKKFYEGQNIFVGIDVHARQWHVFASPYPGGMGFKAFSMPPNAVGLKKHLDSTFPGASFKSAYESGFCGFAPHRELIGVGIDNIVFNAADLRKSQKEQLRKTDAVDCKAIWENHAKGDLKGIFIPSDKQEADRELIRGREVAVKDLRRCRQRIRMFLYKLGIETTEEFKGKESYWSNGYVAWLEIIADSLQSGASRKLHAQLEQMKMLKKQIREYDKEIHSVMTQCHQEMYRLLTTVPGIGRLLAAKLCLELMDFSRFPDARHLAGYIGLVPDCKASDTKVDILGTSIRRNSILRTSMIEASWIAISRDPSLGKAFQKYRREGKHPNVAIISVARKLVNRIFYVWRTKKEYEVSKE